MLEVLETTKSVRDKAQQVLINEEALERFVRDSQPQALPLPDWGEHHFRGADEDMAAYLLVLDTLNFCFWPAEGRPRWEVEYKAQWFSGYYALAVALKKAFEQGVPLQDAAWLARLSPAELGKILKGRGQLQLIQERLKNLNELGRGLLSAYHGQAHELVAAAQGSAPALARLLAATFSSFDDTALYQGQKIFFYKRAQILAADLRTAFNGRDLGALRDMDQLTAFADYKLPQVLRHLNILRYQAGLAAKIDQRILLTPGSREEIEIRACTIQAVDLMRQKLSARFKTVAAHEIDAWLWHLGQQDAFRLKPYHHTATIFY